MAAWSSRNLAASATRKLSFTHSISACGGSVSLPRIAITIGDPAGVGPEVALKALVSRDSIGPAQWTLIGDDVALRAIQPDYRERFNGNVRFVSPGLLDQTVPIRFGE